MLRGMPHGAVETFTQSVQPVLLNHCATSGCHGPQSEIGLAAVPCLGGQAGEQANDAAEPLFRAEVHRPGESVRKPVADRGQPTARHGPARDFQRASGGAVPAHRGLGESGWQGGRRRNCPPRSRSEAGRSRRAATGRDSAGTLPQEAGKAQPARRRQRRRTDSPRGTPAQRTPTTPRPLRSTNRPTRTIPRSSIAATGRKGKQQRHAVPSRSVDQAEASCSELPFCEAPGCHPRLERQRAAYTIVSANSSSARPGLWDRRGRRSRR